MAYSVSYQRPPITSIPDEFTCKICLDILKKPVQCRRNEHYFCTVCINKHLKRTQSCPFCVEKLTTETLRPIPRVVADLLSQIETPRCKYVQRGCKEKIKYQNQAIHHQVCGFAPVLCSNEGCGETVNKQDQASHEKERCQFRKTKCEVCNEEMVQCNYGKHSCVLRQELDEMKLYLVEMSSSLKEIQEELTKSKSNRKPIRNFPEAVEPTSSSSSLRNDRKQFRSGQQPLKLKDSSSSNRRHVSGQIVVAGGNDDKTVLRSYEVFNWSTKSWTFFEDAFFFDHCDSFSFPYNNNIMICGGTSSNRIECLNVVKPSDSFVFPTCLPSTESGKGVVYGDQIITFGDSVSKTSLKPPYSSKVISAYNNNEVTRYYGVESINESVVVVGGELDNWGSVTDNVMLYNSVTNELKQLAPLPYRVSHMATVPYKDNIIILGGQVNAVSYMETQMILLGGQEKECSSLNRVIMYNVTNQQCKKLPSMLEKRSDCTAVIMGEMIVVMGGRTEGRYGKALNTVEYLVLGEDSWKELPSMHCARESATASVQV